MASASRKRAGIAGPCKPGRAVTILQGRLTALPGTHHRDRAVHLARLGAAHAADQIPDAAAIAGLASLTETRRAGSTRPAPS
ncbi:hypothetical protein [Actinomadura sp. SCN-SB]|uniref:hypothetical protein n=1 Tax=Actinomadura sp. SCN-SB TaxID=3373092 RepID=UPI00375274C4